MHLLFTSAGRRGYLLRWFKEALGPSGRVHAANSDANASAFADADYTVVVPEIHDPDYVPFLLNYCRVHSIRGLIPLFDIDLPVLAKERERFAAIGVEVLTADAETSIICNDKWRTFEYLRDVGIDVPFTFTGLAEAQQALSSGTLHYPVFVKPRWGMGSIGVFKAENTEELQVLYAKAQREVQRTFLRFESAATPDEMVLVQECLDGQEYGMDVVNDLAGVNVTTFVKRKLAMRSGETDSAVTVDDEELVALGARLGKLLKHRGNLDTDVFRTNTGRVVVLEMNARFGGGYPFSHLAGADLPRAIVAWLRGTEPDPHWLRVDTGKEGAKSIVPIPRSW